MPDHVFWSIRQHLKARMLHLVQDRVRAQHFRNQGSEAHVDRLLKLADPANPNVLTIGFARRFATYKRSTLLFEKLDWLRDIVGDPDRPVVFIFAGKAHPADEPGKEMIRRVNQVSWMRDFEGRVIFVEGYDLRLARRLISGVDVWLNNPVYPLEASGTSGMKAGFNGVVNLSVLDGWWGEGYHGDNGWAIKPASEMLDDARRAQRRGEPLALRAPAGQGDPALLRPRHDGLLARVDQDGEALDHDAPAALQQPAHGGRVPHALLRAGVAAPRRARGRAQLRARARARASGSASACEMRGRT